MVEIHSSYYISLGQSCIRWSKYEALQFESEVTDIIYKILPETILFYRFTYILIFPI